MQIANRQPETLTPRTGVEAPGRPEDTAGGRVAPRTRRDVLKWGLFGSLLATLGGFGWAFLQFFTPRQIGLFGSKVTAGKLADFPVNTVTKVSVGKFYISHLPEGMLALYWKCKHLGCTVPWHPDEEFQGQVGVFHCPCHGSIYLRTGQNVAGPAPAPLDYMDIEFNGDTVIVNTGKISTRVQYDPSQVTKI